MSSSYIANKEKVFVYLHSESYLLTKLRIYKLLSKYCFTAFDTMVGNTTIICYSQYWKTNINCCFFIFSTLDLQIRIFFFPQNFKVFQGYNSYYWITSKFISLEQEHFAYFSTKLIIDADLLFYCREFTSRILRSYAILNVENSRSRSVSAESFFLVPHIPGIWGDYAQITKSQFVKKIGGFEDFPTGKNSDQECMRLFLVHSRASKLVDPNLTEFFDMIPCRAPLIDHLSLDSERYDSWDFPKKSDIELWVNRRGISTEWKNGVEIREFIIGVDSADDLVEFEAFVQEHLREDARRMPTSVLSFDVEVISVTLYDLLRMGSLNHRDTHIYLTHDLEKNEAGETCDKKEPFPAKVMWGNGVQWCAILSFDIRKSGEGYTYNSQGIPTGILQLLESLPVVTGLGIREDVMLVEKVFGIISRLDVQMQGFVELGSLAVLAGWRLEARSMTAMSMIALGGAMNKMCSAGDGTWGLKYSSIAEPLQVYAIANVKFGFITYNVLISLLMRQLFPDPDICCHMAGCMQEQWADWFFKWIRDTLIGTVVYDPDVSVAGTRRELMAALKYRQESDGRLSRYSPARVALIADLMEWPTLTQGGPRYLQPARLMFLSHYQLLRECNGVPGAAIFFVREISPEDQLYATYGHDDIEQADVTVPVPMDPAPEFGPDFWLELVSHPHLQKRLFIPPFHDISIQTLHEAARVSARDTREALFEWMRLDVRRIQAYFDACSQDLYLSRSYRGKYETIRILYVNLVNRQPVGAEACEADIKKEVVQSMDREQEYLRKLQIEVRKQESICEALVQANVDSPVVNRTSWKLLPKPEWKVTVQRHLSLVDAHEPTGSKRSRSQSRTRSASGRGQRSYRGHSLPGRARGVRVRGPPVQHRGRPLEERLGNVGGRVDVDLDRVQHLEERGESSTGGRVSKKSRRSKSRSVSRSKPPTQDEDDEDLEKDISLDFCLDD